MFLTKVGKPTKIKNVIYLVTSTILGLFLSLIAHALIEMNIISSTLDQGKLVQFYGDCALPPIFQALLLIIGGFTGFMVGLIWWRKIYIERIWLRKI